MQTKLSVLMHLACDDLKAASHGYCSRCVEQDAVIKVQRISASILLNQVLCNIKRDWLKHEPRSTCLLV